MALSDNEFSGKVALVTGACCGIGEALTLEMARRKARVVMLVRDKSRGEAAISRIREAYPAADIHLEFADLSLASSVARFCENFRERFDILVNNAGVFGLPYERTEEGAETVMATNHLGHFLLTCLLIARGQISSSARIILVTASHNIPQRLTTSHKISKHPGNTPQHPTTPSGAYYNRGSLNIKDWDENWTESNYGMRQAYSNSKLAVCLFALWLRSTLRRTVGSSAKVFAVHPGVVNTNISRHLTQNLCLACLYCCLSICMQSPLQGCQGILVCAADHDNSRVSGTYFNNRSQEPWHKPILNEKLVLSCWDFSFNWVKRSITDANVIKQLRDLRELPRDSLDDLPAA